jgi:hypothetical protein
MEEFIVTMNREHAAALGEVRCLDGLQVADKDAVIWIKGMLNDAHQSALKRLPVTATYYKDAQNRLFICGEQTPVAILEEMNWQPIGKFVTVELPVSALPAQVVERVGIKLIPVSVTHDGDALMVDLDTWKKYGEGVSSVRLGCLHFAVSESGRVLITGMPLPPLPGAEYWMQEDMLIPAGYDFEWSMAACFITERLNAGRRDIMLSDEKGNLERIAKSMFVPATRSAIRMTKERSTRERTY